MKQSSTRADRNARRGDDTIYQIIYTRTAVLFNISRFASHIINAFIMQMDTRHVIRLKCFHWGPSVFNAAANN